MTLKVAIPNKGRLSADSIALLSAVGFKLSQRDDRQLYYNVGDKYQILSVRAQDIPAFVESSSVDMGLTGLDLVKESGKKVSVLTTLGFGQCELVVAVPEHSAIKGIKDIPNGTKVATTHPNITRAFFAKKGRKITVVDVSGSVEIAPLMKVSDIIVDLTETGSTLKSNGLRPIQSIMKSEAVVVSRAGRGRDVRVSELVAALKSVTDAAAKRYLMANVPKARLDEVRALMPGISGPTVMDLAGHPGWVAVHAVVGETEVNGVIAMLKGIGATGVLVLPIERMVP